MAGVLEAIGFIVVLFVMMVVAIYALLKKPGANSEVSKYVVNYFEPDNTAPKLTKLIEYHKASNRKIKYKIQRDNDGKN